MKKTELEASPYKNQTKGKSLDQNQIKSTINRSEKDLNGKDLVQHMLDKITLKNTTFDLIEARKRVESGLRDKAQNFSPFISITSISQSCTVFIVNLMGI
jgi:hypothetical protein